MLVLLPYVKSGAEKKLETNSSLMLAEAEALVRTLEWKVQLQQIILSSTRVCACSHSVVINYVGSSLKEALSSLAVTIGG